MTVVELSEDEISERLARLQGDSDGDGSLEGLSHVSFPQDGPTSAIPTNRYRFVRPLSEAADSLIDFMQNSDGRLMLGLPEIDLLTRGFGPGELIYITGYTHSGKTQVALTAIVNNRDRRFVVFTMDEPVELVLTKLVCARTGSNAERLEERIKANDAEAIARVRRIAAEDFSNVIVIDQSMTLDKMSAAIKEAEDYWGAPVDCAMIDYLELMGNAEGVDVEEASQKLKGWVMSHDFPTICLHQGSRGNSAGGQRLTLRSMKYAGEQEAIMVLGVRRKRDDEDLDDYERLREANTVEISILKNKRPPSKIGESTFYMEPASGLVLPLSHRPEALTGVAAVRAASSGYPLSPGQTTAFEEEDY